MILLYRIFNLINTTKYVILRYNYIRYAQEYLQHDIYNFTRSY